MPRRRQIEEEDHRERWLVSYADFITLLFAFFVVMYAISSVNEGKYRVLSSTLTNAFMTPTTSKKPIQVGELARTELPVSGDYAAQNPDADTSVVMSADPSSQQPNAILEVAPNLDEVVEQLSESLGDFIDKELVNVNRTSRGIEVEMKSKMLFSSGSARLSSDALSALRGVARIIGPIPNQVHVEGHTDNIPIKTLGFPSNWELSAARAASVVHLFERYGVGSNRMAAIGFGEFRPIADNRNEQGRQKNRRVALVVLAAEKERAEGRVGKPDTGSDTGS
ncbi:MAG: flagellar motor protein MotD [Gammaproteobacteria bacterium]|nr:flagellar motor protein MotD [Gammaproteobacteria bacterium]